MEKKIFNEMKIKNKISFYMELNQNRFKNNISERNIHIINNQNNKLINSNRVRYQSISFIQLARKNNQKYNPLLKSSPIKLLSSLENNILLGKIFQTKKNIF